ncbi:helix-turn-helix domain-containing protein [Paenibacillus allorhizosphaerae]|uniref:HTH-type transcriptional activator Btr n=1 Tax=Paenibacillus allorhizosphaerae TaxID=2849866 RepID=A0ABM8VBF3_9BACL|nr:AraC family transcriptional regulator [Paenibacillus allorhizosphaerae]CAG7619267.1 HTH-type transcriptional activator Btr [Paenibacillus allorhizosphaerae]
MNTSFDIRSFIGSHNEDWFDDRLHQHSTVEFSVVLEGRGLFVTALREYPIEVGHVVIIPPNYEHRFAAVTKVRFGVIHLSYIPAQLNDMLQKLGCYGEHPRMVALSRIDKDRFERLFREWLFLKSSSFKDKQRNYMAWMEMLLLFLYEHSQTDLQAMTVTKAADYIREHLRENVHIRDLAELTGLTNAGFRRLFEQIYDMSPKQFQQQCRMDEAKWLLNSSDKSIEEIAEKVGFFKLHSFSQWFKKKEGVSPTVWRKTQQIDMLK